MQGWSTALGALVIAYPDRLAGHVNSPSRNDLHRSLDKLPVAVVRSRRRTGATRWAIYQDSATPGLFAEAFTVGSWSEHVRQHTDRVTGHDRQLLDIPRALTDGQPVVRHLLSPRMPPQMRPIRRSPSSG